jgi:hypothetical protein
MYSAVIRNQTPPFGGDEEFMQPFAPSFLTTLAAGWRRDLWLAILVATCVGLSLFFACVMPFGALAAVAAFTLSKRHAYLFVLGAWLVNQAIGFSFLDYPRDANTILWGVAIAVAVLGATWAARLTAEKLSGSSQVVKLIAALFAAVAVYEVLLFVAALTPLGGSENFGLEIVVAVFAVNIAALAFICLLNLLALVTGLVIRERAPASVSS